MCQGEDGMRGDFTDRAKVWRGNASALFVLAWLRTCLAYMWIDRHRCRDYDEDGSADNNRWCRSCILNEKARQCQPYRLATKGNQAIDTIDTPL